MKQQPTEPSSAPVKQNQNSCPNLGMSEESQIHGVSSAGDLQKTENSTEQKDALSKQASDPRLTNWAKAAAKWKE
jgi:hypothetical protein